MKVIIFISILFLDQSLWKRLVNLSGIKKDNTHFRMLVKAQNIYRSHLEMPDLKNLGYVKLRDINIGSLLSLTKKSKTSEPCSGDITSGAWLTSERIAFATDYVNQHPTLLRDVRLGFALLDFCYTKSNSLASSLAFIPHASCQNNSSCKEECSWPSANFDVIGIICPASSSNCVPVSSLYSVARIPVVGYVSTSDELSDKSQHPYFSRVLPPDKHQVEAMLNFISGNNWTYISVVYAQGSYGEKAFDNIKENVDKYSICIATQHRLISSVSYVDIARDLIKHSRARALILWIGSAELVSLLSEIKKLNYLNHFILIGSDSWSYSYEEELGENSDLVTGAFSFGPYTKNVPSFRDYLGKQKIHESVNPFMKTAWEHLNDCSFAEGTCDSNKSVSSNTKLQISSSASLYFDAVLAFAYAADNLLRDRCPGYKGKEARACITGDLLQEYIKNVSYDGFTGHVEFDEYLDAKGKYEIRQIVYDYIEIPEKAPINQSSTKGLQGRVIGIYDIVAQGIIYTSLNISWSHLKTVERILPLTNETMDDRPESVCSRPCLEREYTIQGEVRCCWICHMCRDNERLTNADTKCEICPIFTWPESATGYRTCSFIPLTYAKLSDTMSVILFCLSVATLIFTTLVILAYIKYRNERVIKASSRELSYIQLSAILLGYVTVMIFQLKPSDVTCKIMYFLFSLTFALLYCPLLVKTVRIYRIFRSASKDNKRPRFVSPQSQIVMSFLLIGIQVLLCILIDVLFNPSAKTEQPIWTKKIVELTCDLTTPGLTSFLAYNLILVTLCSIFAFKTRKLPDNFNEARFISMCVYTTLVIWLAFIPTYFTADRVFVRSLLKSAALLLNHSVALLFLFVPKIYAAVYVPSEQLNFATTRFQTQHNTLTTTARRGPSGNQISPNPRMSATDA